MTEATTERLPGLDLLRSLAILWVMLFHSFIVGGLGSDWAWLSRYGWMGVDLFFVLSGFLIGNQVLRPLTNGQQFSFKYFYLRRAFRILPAYLAVLLAYLIWPAFREAPGMEPGWKFITFTLNLSIDYINNTAFSHAWSLCVEEHFYLIFPLLAVWLMRRPTKWKFVAACACIVIAGIGLRSAIWLQDTASGSSLYRNWYVEDIYYPTWNRLDGLLAGIVLATLKVLHPHTWARLQNYANTCLMIGMATMALAFWLFSSRMGLLGNSIGWPVLSASLGLLVFAGASRDSLIGKWNVPGAGWLAAISYSLYLVHKPMYHLIQVQWGEQLADRGAIAFITFGVGAIAAGALLHYLVERPFLRLRERLFMRRQYEAPALQI
ncbi:MAG: acyltransferase [Steroidobacteraceae bacterium]